MKNIQNENPTKLLDMFRQMITNYAAKNGIYPNVALINNDHIYRMLLIEAKNHFGRDFKEKLFDVQLIQTSIAGEARIRLAYAMPFVF